MKCTKCGFELNEDAQFCPECGQEVTKQVEEPKVWTTFGKLSKIFGIVSVATCWIPYLFAWSFAIPALVFGILSSKKSSIDLVKANGRKGKTLSIVALIISGVVYAIVIAVLAVIYLRSNS